MKCTIDPEKLKAALIGLSREDRGYYISVHVQKMIEGTCNESWITKETKKALSKTYTEAFNTFWDLYPARNGSRTGKAPAFKAWQRTKVDEEELLDLCREALAWQTKSSEWVKDKGQFIPMASTYLNQRRWEDERPETPDGGGYRDMDGVWHDA